MTGVQGIFQVIAPDDEGKDIDITGKILMKTALLEVYEINLHMLTPLHVWYLH